MDARISLGQTGRFANLRRLLTSIAILALLVCPAGWARERLLASPYGPLANDVLSAFGAEVVPCVGAIDAAEVCFVVHVAGPTYLATELETVLEEYRQAGLAASAWQAANGVWKLSVWFMDGSSGELQVFLSETTGSSVRGVLVFIGP